MKKRIKFTAFFCAISLVMTLIVFTVPTAALSEEIWDFEDYNSQGVSSYLNSYGFDLNSGASTMDIVDKEANGKMLMLKPGSRLIRWYYPGQPGGGTPIAEDFTLELDIMQEEKSALADIATAASATWNADKYVYQLISNGTDIQLRHGGGTTTLVANYQAGTVYRIKISVEFAAKRLKAWVDGVQVKTAADMRFLGKNNIPDVSRFDFNIGSSGTLFVGRMSISPYINIENELAKLQAAIQNAENVLNSLEPGEYLGQCSAAAWDALDNAIGAAQARYDAWLVMPPEDAALVTQEIQTLAAAQGAAEGDIHTAFSTLYTMDFDSKDLTDDGWDIYQPNGELVTVDGNRVLKVYNTGQTSRVLRSFSPAVSSAATVQFSFMLEERKAVTAIAEIKSAPLSETDTVFNVSATGSDIMLGNQILISGYEANRWYDITLDLDITTRTIKAYVDGVRVLADKTLSYIGSTASVLSRWETQIQAVGSAVLIDNIVIQKNINADFIGEAKTLAVGFGDVKNVISNLALPAEHNGYAITWSSDDESVITNKGVVTRSDKATKTVTLSALIQKDGYTYKHKYVLMVPKLFYGLLVDSDFESDSIGEAPAGWRIKSGSVTVGKEQDNQYAAVSGAMYQSFDFKDIFPAGFAAASFMQTDKSQAESLIRLAADEQTMFKIWSDGTSLLVSYSDGESVIAENYEANRWYSVSVPFDVEAKRFSLVVNGGTVLDNQPMSFSATGGKGTISLGAADTVMYADDIAVGRSKPATVSLTNDTDSVLRPASGNALVNYKAVVRDVSGRMILGDKLIWSITNKSGATPAGITIADGVVTISTVGESGTFTVRAEMADDASVYAEKTLEVIAQKIKTIRISGQTQITHEGTYTYTAEVISEYGVVLPSAGIVWSVSGDGVTISSDGVLGVQSSLHKSIQIKATLGDSVGKLDISVRTVSGGSSGGGGGGGFTACGTAVKGNNNGGSHTADAPTNREFSDVPSDFWAADAIYALHQKGIITGTSANTFHPNGQVTRAQFAKLLAKTFALPEASNTTPFSDVEEGAWYSSCVRAVWAAGIVSGYQDGSFGTEHPITRQDVAVMLVRALEHRGVSLKTETLYYNDCDDIADYAADAAAKALAAGIMHGKDDKMFEPKSCMTRSEAAVVFYRVLSMIEG